MVAGVNKRWRWLLGEAARRKAKGVKLGDLQLDSVLHDNGRFDIITVENGNMLPARANLWR